MSAELPAGVRIRTAMPDDHAGVQGLLTASGLEHEAGTASLAKLFVAHADDAVVGSIAMERFGGESLMRAACVDPAWRGRGVGSALVEHALTEAALEAVDSVYLITPSAARFFARFGFIEVADRDLPVTITRAVARVGARTAEGMAMRLKLAEP